jgi:hypothetical protein
MKGLGFLGLPRADRGRGNNKKNATPNTKEKNATLKKLTEIKD